MAYTGENNSFHDYVTNVENQCCIDYIPGIITLKHEFTTCTTIKWVAGWNVYTDAHYM